MLDLEKYEGFSDVANNLVNKISEAIGWRTTSKTKKLAIESFIDDIKQSNLEPIEKAAIISNAGRIIKEYSNQANIINKAQPLLESPKTEEMDDDWIASFMDKARLISDDEFQIIWANILAKEAEKPGSFSLRTLDVLKCLSKTEAELFQKYVSIAVLFGGNAYVMENIYNPTAKYGEILILEESGLISSSLITSTIEFKGNEEIPFLYNDNAFSMVKCIVEGNEKIKFTGYAFTKSGNELIKAIQVDKKNYELIKALKEIKQKNQDRIEIILYDITEEAQKTIDL